MRQLFFLTLRSTTKKSKTELNSSLNNQRQNFYQSETCYFLLFMIFFVVNIGLIDLSFYLKWDFALLKIGKANKMKLLVRIIGFKKNGSTDRKKNIKKHNHKTNRNIYKGQ